MKLLVKLAVILTLHSPLAFADDIDFLEEISSVTMEIAENSNDELADDYSASMESSDEADEGTTDLEDESATDLADEVEHDLDIEPEAESVEAAAAKVPEVVKEKVSPRASASTLKTGFHVTSQQCAARSKPNVNSKQLIDIAAGKKLWVEGHNSEWAKVFRKKGVAFLPAHCL